MMDDLFFGRHWLTSSSAQKENCQGHRCGNCVLVRTGLLSLHVKLSGRSCCLSAENTLCAFIQQIILRTTSYTSFFLRFGTWKIWIILNLKAKKIKLIKESPVMIYKMEIQIIRILFFCDYNHQYFSLAPNIYCFYLAICIIQMHVWINLKGEIISATAVL